MNMSGDVIDIRRPGTITAEILEDPASAATEGQFFKLGYHPEILNTLRQSAENCLDTRGIGIFPFDKKDFHSSVPASIRSAADMAVVPTCCTTSPAARFARRADSSRLAPAE